MKQEWKGKFDSSPLSIKEKLFYGVRRNPTPRKERTYPTGKPKLHHRNVTYYN